MYGGHTVGVVVPAYNEEGFVGNVIDSLPNFVDRVYVVDDASTDDTWEEVSERAVVERPPRDATSTDERTILTDGDGGSVVAIRHRENRGAGGAIKTGYLAARDDRMDVTVTLDADGQMDPNMMTKFIDPLVSGEADYAKGDRLSDATSRRDMPQFRLVGNWLLTGLTRIASGYWNVTDPQNGYTAISIDALESIELEEMYEYYGYCNDLLVKLNVADKQVADVPMDASYGDEESGIQYDDYVPKVSLMLLRNFLWRLTARYRAHPLGVAYGVGVVAGLVALVRAAKAVGAAVTGAESDDARGSLVAVLVGCVAVFAGVVLDRRENA